jgi:hypothetical protein
MESSWWLHHEHVGDLGLVWGSFYQHGEATDTCGSVEPTQVLLVRGLVEWSTKVVHIGGSLSLVIHPRHHPIRPRLLER